MPPVIRISESLYQRLSAHAEGFDTPANVIERLLDQVEGVSPAPMIIARAVFSGRSFTSSPAKTASGRALSTAEPAKSCFTLRTAAKRKSPGSQAALPSARTSVRTSGPGCSEAGKKSRLSLPNFT